MPQQFVVPRPSGVPAIVGAAVWMAYLTAYGGLVEAGQLHAGQTLVITAASSSVGIAAIQVARHVGARVVASTNSPDKRAALLAAGAHKVIVTGTTPLADALVEVAPEGIDSVFDAVGGPDLDAFAGALRRNGIIVVHGALSDEPTPFPVRLSIRKSLVVRGFVYTEMVLDAATRARATGFINDALANKALVPLIDRVFPLSDVVEAHWYLQSNRQVGKIVLSNATDGVIR